MLKPSKFCQDCAPNKDLEAYNIYTIGNYMTNGSYIKLPIICPNCGVRGIWKTKKGHLRLRTNKPFIKPKKK